jgi:hypothetical protein
MSPPPSPSRAPDADDRQGPLLLDLPLEGHRSRRAPRSDDGRAPGLGTFAELLALTGITIAQPVLDSIQHSPETLVYRRSTTTEILLFGLLVTFALPAALWSVERLLACWSTRVQRAVHLVVLAGLFGLGGWQLATRGLAAPWPARVATAAVLAAGGTLLVTRSHTVRRVLQWFALSPVLVLALWLASGNVNRIAFAEGPGTAHGLPMDNPAPVVFIVFDEFPLASLLDDNGGIDETLWPSFARLAEDATWYRNTTSVSPTTPDAVPAILTGRYPTEPGEPPTAASHPDNLFRALSGAYELNVWEMVTQLCPPAECPTQGGSVDHGITPLLSDAAEVWSEYLLPPDTADDDEFAVRQSDPEAPRRLEQFATSLTDADAPRLDFLHVPFPHQPWFHLPSGARHDAPFLAEGLDGAHSYAWKSHYFAQAGRQRHLLQLQRTDRALGELLRTLDDLDRYDESLIVVTADHGVAFREGSPIRGLDDETVSQVMWVPLFVKAPGQEAGAVDDRPVETIDILPTITDHLGLDLPWETDGTSALEPRILEDEERRFYPWKHNQLPLDGEGGGFSLVDGAEGFRDLFAVPPAGSEPRDDLQLSRFGRWGPLVGTEVADLELGAPAMAEARLTDADGDPVGEDHFQITAGEAVLPVYVRGTVESPLPADVLLSVNGFVAGWGEVFRKDGASQWFVLAPQELFATGTNDLELFTVTGEPDSPVLHPVRVDWATG